MTAGLTALSFILTWSNFLDPLVYVYDRDLFTLPLAVLAFRTPPDPLTAVLIDLTLSTGLS